MSKHEIKSFRTWEGIALDPLNNYTVVKAANDMNYTHHALDSDGNIVGKFAVMANVQQNNNGYLTYTREYSIMRNQLRSAIRGGGRLF